MYEYGLSDFLTCVTHKYKGTAPTSLHRGTKMYLVVHRGDVVANNLSKPDAVDVALRQNGFHHRIIRDEHGIYNLHLKRNHNGPFQKTQFGSAKSDWHKAVDDIYNQVYNYRYLYDLQIYTPEQYKLMYQTTIK